MNIGLVASRERETRRSYRSDLREERARRTRRRVLDAARNAFVAGGYSGTTMRSIAIGAGVSVPTVELLFRTKALMLKAAIDVAIAGDDEPVPILDRAWATTARQAVTVDELLTVTMRVLGSTQERSAGLVLAALEASSTEADLAEVSEQLVAQRESTAGWLVDRIASLAELRSGLTRHDAMETVWLLMDPAVYVRLTRHRRWSGRQYQDWVARSIRHSLLPDSPTAPGSARAEDPDRNRVHSPDPPPAP